MDTQEQLTPQEEQELINILGSDYPKGAEKENIFAFFNKILKAKKSELSKVGNLDENEIIAVRIYQQTALYALEMDLDKVAEYLLEKADVIVGTSDSKEGFLIRSAITQKKELQTQERKGEKKSKWKLN